MQNGRQYNMPPHDCSERKGFYKYCLQILPIVTYSLYSLLLFYHHYHRVGAAIYRWLTDAMGKSYQPYVFYNSENNMNQSNEQSGKSNPATEWQTQQLIDLQMSMAHLELTVERLDEVIARQDRDIQTLQRQLQLIYKQVENQDSEAGIAPFDVLADKPPHY